MASFTDDTTTLDFASTFSDVTPLPQHDGPFPICAIQYPERFALAMSYFRAILKSGELSERSLLLTAAVIDGNPANYTAWHLRRRCLVALGKPLGPEIDFTSRAGGDNPKNYQIWFHRRSCLDQLEGETSSAAASELEYVGRVIEDDSKNYHAWSHRQHIVSKFDLWDGELAFVTAAIEADIRNNSAWNQRWFATHGESPKAVLDLEAEVDYALEVAGRDVHNESPIKYCLGLLKESWKKGVGEKETDKVVEKMLEWKDQNSSHVHSLLVDVYARRGGRENLEKAGELCDELAEEVDGVRGKFWRWRKGRMSEGA